MQTKHHCKQTSMQTNHEWTKQQHMTRIRSNACIYKVLKAPGGEGSKLNSCWTHSPEVQNGLTTNEILTCPSLRIMFQWCSHSLTFSRMAQGETPLGQFSVVEKCSNGVSPSVDCFSYGLGWDTIGAIFCFRKMPQWCLTFGWLFLVWYSTYVFNSWVWLHVGTSVVGIPCNEVSWSYRAGSLG